MRIFARIQLIPAHRVHFSASSTMSTDEEVAIDIIGRMGRASGFLNDEERKRELPIACAAAKETLLRGAQRLVHEAAGRPILTSKSCDGTPITIVHRSTVHQPGGKAVRSHGRECKEFLVQNQFLRVDMGLDGWQTKVLLSEPTPLTHGKSVPAILAASRANWYSLRQLGHTGCAVEHYVWDRGGITALDRETRKWHLEQAAPSLPAHISERIARMTEFVLVTPCALHDSQNAFRWSLHQAFTDQELMRDIYICIESLRRSADLIKSHLYEWIGKTMRRREDQGQEWVDHRRQLWLDLGVDMETADLLAAELQLWWDGCTLWSLSGAFADGCVLTVVASALLACWRFRAFTESRWLTVGSSVRALVAGFFTGLGSLVKFILKDPKASNF